VRRGGGDGAVADRDRGGDGRVQPAGRAAVRRHGAPDVAFVEAVLGSAFVGVLLLVAVLVTGDRAAGRDRRAVLGGRSLVLAFAGLMLLASVDLPDRGDPTRPPPKASLGSTSRARSPTAKTPNVVTAVLADYRSLDTLGETLVVFSAALAAAVVLHRGVRS
jgi:multicomponent Na+:H+ antiporter subunit B